MARARMYMEKMLFSGSPAQRRRQMRFYLIAVLLGACLSSLIGALLYILSGQGHI